MESLCLPPCQGAVGTHRESKRNGALQSRLRYAYGAEQPEAYKDQRLDHRLTRRLFCILAINPARTP
jgi:hypothetical protein